MTENTEAAIKILDIGSFANPRHAEMFAISRAHGEAEFTQDLDYAMSALTDDIFWELGNLGIRCEGSVAVREWYRRILPVLIGAIEDVEEKSVAFGENHLVVDHQLTVRMPDGSVRQCPNVSFYHFRGDQICGERSFCDAEMIKLYEAAMGPDVTSFPGIRLLQN